MSFDSRTLLVCIAAGSSLGVLGCVPPPYRPAAPHQIAGEGIRVEITRASTLSTNVPGLVVSAEIEGEKGAKLRRVLLTPSKADPCREGIRSHHLVLDDEPQWLRPVSVEGKHALRLEFPSGAAHDLLRDATAIDFVVAAEDGDRCVRIPLTGAGAALAWTAPLNGVAGGQVRGYFPAKAVAGVGAGWSLDSYVGGYLGPFRLQAELGFGSANCKTDCLGSTSGFLWLPLGVSTHVYLVDKGGVGLDLGLGYRWLFASTRSKDASRGVRLEAPELSLRFAATADQGIGLPNGHRVAAAGFDLFVANWRWHGAAGVESSFVWGLGFGWDHGF